MSNETKSNGQDPTPPAKPRTLDKYFRRYRNYFIVGFFVIIGSNIFLAISPWLVKEAVDSFPNRSLPSLAGWTVYETMKDAAIPAAEYAIPWYAAAIVLTVVIGGTFRFFSRRSIIWASRFIEYDLRNELFRHLLRLSASFYQRTPTGDIIARTTNDIEAIRQLTGPAIMYFLNFIIGSIAVLGAMFLISPRMTLYTMLPLPLLSLVMWWVGKETHKRYRKVQDHFSDMSAFVQESMAGIRVIKAYRREAHRQEMFREVNRKYVDLNLSLARVRAVFYPIISLLANYTMLLVIGIGGFAVMSVASDFTAGALIAFIVYLGMLIWPMLSIGWVINLYQRGTASLKRVDLLLHEEPDITDVENPQKPAGSGEVKVEDLSFTYPGTSTQVLRDVSFSVRPGESVAIVGSTGSGKTTLVSLLMRTYKVPDNTIFIDGVDINQMPVDDLRGMIGFVQQDPYLFSNTIAANIAFSKDKVDDDEVHEAAVMAAFDSEVDSFPKKYRTVLGERGITLSGGQKQRAAIARALLKRPKILVFDDAFSAVDTQTEELILEHLKSIEGRATTFIISHRPSTIKRADKIVVLDEGTVVEVGTHEDLLRKQGRYYELIRREEMADELKLLD